MQACLGDRGRWAPKSYLPGPILYCPGAQGAQGLRCVASEGVFVHSSISVSCPLALRARRFHGVRPRGWLVLNSNFSAVCPGAWSAQVLAPQGCIMFSRSHGLCSVAPGRPGTPSSLNRARRLGAFALRRRSAFVGRCRWLLPPLAEDALELARSCTALSTPPPPRAGGVPP